MKIGFTGLLFLIFLTLKLTGHITWSWWWVASPLWIPLAIVFLVMLFMFAMAILTGGTINMRRR